MKKKTKFILAGIGLLIVLRITARVIYDRYYKISLTSFNRSTLIGVAKSPDGKHEVKSDKRVYVEGNPAEAKDGETAGYLLCVVTNTENQEYREILWLNNFSSDHVTVEWLDNRTVRINNLITLDIYKDMYDYRRNW